LRDATPRAAHGGWKPPKDRRDPIELLRESNEGRMPELIPIRFGRMAQSPFAATTFRHVVIAAPPSCDGHQFESPPPSPRAAAVSRLPETCDSVKR
jgi:hypothetical protein